MGLGQGSESICKGVCMINYLSKQSKKENGERREWGVKRKDGES